MKHEIKNVTKAQLEHLIDEYVLGFKAERNRSIMKRRLLAGITFEDLSYEYDMSVNQIKNIVYRQLEVLVKHIEVG